MSAKKIWTPLVVTGAVVVAAVSLWHYTQRRKKRSRPGDKLRDLEFDDKDKEKSSVDIALAAMGLDGSVAPSECDVKAISGGITNVLFRASFPPAANTSPVLVRRFGAEGMIDREVEDALFAALAAKGIAPPYHGRFKNGRVEGFMVDCVVPSLDELADPAFSPLIAVETAKLHRFEPPTGLLKDKEPSLWKQIWEWFALAKEVRMAAGSPEATQYSQLNLERVESRLKALQASIPSNSLVCFCHNDILFANILIHTPSGAVNLIDFEYGGYNFRAFDIANHFNEWAGGTEDGITDYSRFPNATQQRTFVRAYLEAYEGTAPSEAAVEALIGEVELFVEVDNFFWGLWAVVQAGAEGCDDFPYLTYAHNRINRAFEA